MEYLWEAAAQEGIHQAARFGRYAFDSYKRNRDTWDTSAPGDAEFTPQTPRRGEGRKKTKFSEFRPLPSGMNNSGCYTRTRRTTGVARYSRSSYNDKLVDVTRDGLIYRVQGMSLNPFGTAQGGFYRMTNTNFNNNLGQTAPLCMFELNAAANFNKDSGSFVANPVVGWECYFTDTVAGGIPVAVNFRPIGGVIGQSNSLAVEQASNSSTMQMGPRALLDWVDIRMLWYAAGTVPTRIRIDIVSFDDAEDTPTGVGDISDTVANVLTFNDPDKISLYQALTKGYMFNPLENANQQLVKSRLRFHHSETHALDCKMSNMNELNKLKEIRIFNRLNRRCTFAWQNNDLVNMRPDGDFTVNVNKDWSHVDPKARLYLMVRCISGYKNDGALTLGTPPDGENNAPTTQLTLHPSFDMVMRTKYTKITGFQ